MRSGQWSTNRSTCISAASARAWARGPNRHFVKFDAKVAHQNPWPEGPGPIGFVGDDEGKAHGSSSVYAGGVLLACAASLLGALHHRNDKSLTELAQM